MKNDNNVFTSIYLLFLTFPTFLFLVLPWILFSTAANELSSLKKELAQNEANVAIASTTTASLTTEVFPHPSANRNQPDPNSLRLEQLIGGQTKTIEALESKVVDTLTTMETRLSQRQAEVTKQLADMESRLNQRQAEVTERLNKIDLLFSKDGTIKILTQPAPEWYATTTILNLVLAGISALLLVIVLIISFSLWRRIPATIDF